MKWYLAKTDPETYSIGDLERDGQAPWDGVRNPQAVIFLKEMREGDRVLIYHSQGETTIRGLAKVAGESRPDPNDVKSWLVDFKFIRKFKEPWVTLKQIKETGKFNGLRLVYQSRLSTMPVTDEFIAWLKEQGLDLS